MPPLRERQEDIPDLARFLVEKIGKQQSRMLAITDSAIRLLMQHPWPGNVRELENCLERSAIMSANGVIAQDVIELSGINPRGAYPVFPSPTANKTDLDDPDIKNPKGGDWIIGFSLFFGLYGFLSLFLDFFLTEFESYRTFWFRVAQVCVCLLLVIGLMISRSKSRDSN